MISRDGNKIAIQIGILAFVSFCVCDNFTDKFPSARFDTRSSRLISFNTKDDDKIQLELDFSVPFLDIPVTKTMTKGQALANINIKAVALAGLMAFGAAVIIPATYHLFDNKCDSPNNNIPFNRNKYRSDETSTFWNVIATVDKALTEHNIDSTSCTQRAVCWTVQNSNAKLNIGQATSTDKIIDGLATNSWVNHFISGSVFQAAIESGLNGLDCSQEFKQCKINQNTIQKLGKHLVENIYYSK